MLYKNIDELHHQNYFKKRLANGNYLFSFENKVVESNGRFGKPSIEGLVEFNAKNSISLLEDYLYEYINDGHSIQEGVEFVNHLFKEEVATYHGIEDSGQNSREEQQGRSDSENTNDTQRNERREGSLGKNKESVKYSLKDTVEKDVLKHYGKTYRWSETGYIFKDGTRLDLSGRAEGASGGYRAVDHRDIFDILEDNDTEDKIIQFNEWVKKNFKEGKLTATEEEIVRAAVQISKA